MSESAVPPSLVWDRTVRDFAAAAGSAEPVPGGGSVAAVAARLGAGLVAMAVAITRRRRDDPALATAGEQLARLARRMEAAADDDVVAFEALMQAWRDPDRSVRVGPAVHAAEVPLLLAEDAVAAARIATGLGDTVPGTVRSDVAAGVDLLCGAARAALHTVAVNLPELPADVAEPLVRRRDRVLDDLAALSTGRPR